MIVLGELCAWSEHKMEWKKYNDLWVNVNIDFFVMSKAIQERFSRVMKSWLIIIAEYPREWQRINIHGNPYIILFLYCTLYIIYETSSTLFSAWIVPYMQWGSCEAIGCISPMLQQVICQDCKRLGGRWILNRYSVAEIDLRKIVQERACRLTLVKPRQNKLEKWFYSTFGIFVKMMT